MYLTAQRVSAPGDERTGINTFLYKHEGADTGIDWSAPDLVRIAEELPGRPSSSDIHVPPGGNVVRSFLDIVTRDSTDLGAIRSALQKFEEEWSSARLAKVVHVAGVALRLGMELRLEAQALNELRNLGVHALRLLEGSPGNPLWQPNTPLHAIVTKDGQTLSYALDEGSLTRLQALHGSQWKPARVSISQEPLPPATNEPGDLYSHMAPILTGVSLDALVPLGGVQFRDPSGKVLWEWPLPQDARGYCLSCHQHGTLRSSGVGYQCMFCGNEQDTDGLWIATLT